MSTLCTVLNSSTDKGVVVSLHLGCPQKPSAKLCFLISSCFKRFGAFIGGRVKRNTDDIVRCCGLDSTAHSEHDRAGHSTHGRGTSDTEGSGAWPSFSWLVVPFRHVTPVLRVHASPSHLVSVLSFVSASL